MRALAASRGLVRRRPSSFLSTSSLERYSVSTSSLVQSKLQFLSTKYRTCCNHFSSAFTTTTTDDDIAIKSQSTAEDVLLSKYTQITDNILTSEVGSISNKQRFAALEAASYWTRLQTVEGADRAAKLLHRLYDEQDVQPQVGSVPIEQVVYCIDVYRLYSGASLDVPTEGSLASKAEALLTRAEKHSSSTPAGSLSTASSDDDNDDGDNHLNTQVYNMVLDCYAKVGKHEAVQQIMKQMDERCRSDPLSMCSPDNVSYNTLLKALSNSNDPDAPMRSEAVLQRMQNMADAGDPDVAPNGTSFASVISCWGRSSQRDGASRAEQILHRMLELSNGGKSDIKPNAVHFGSVIDAWAKSSASDSAKRVDDVLKLMVDELGDNGGGDTMISGEDEQSNAIAVTSALDAITKSGHGFERAEGFVRAMGSSADNITYTVLIDSFARSGRKDSGEKAEAILFEMIKAYESGNDKVRPTMTTFNAVLNCHSKSKQRDAGKRASNLLQRMKDMQTLGSSDIKLDAISFASCIDAYANSGAPDAGRRGEELLTEMNELCEAGDQSMRPSMVCHSAAINAWATSRDRQAGIRAEALLKQMQQMYAEGDASMKPNEFCYGAVLDAFAKGGDSSNAERFFLRLEALYKDGDAAADPTKQAYLNSVIDSIVRSRRKDAPERCQALIERMKSTHGVEPCVRTKNGLINSISKSGRRDAAEKCESMLREMLDSKPNDEDSMPSSVTFNVCIDAWSKSRHPDAPKRAETLLQEMNSLHSQGYTFIKPDTVSFSSCIVAWGRSRDKNGADRSEAILTHLHSLYEATGDEDLRPNVVSLSAVVSAWAARSRGNPKAAQRALDILEWAYKQYEKGGNRGIRPNTVTFNSAITALSRSGEKESARRGHALLDRMKHQYQDGDLDVKPSRVTFNSVISCYAARPPPNAMEMVDTLLDEMNRLAEEDGDDSLLPDVVTMSSYLGCLAKSRIPDKAQKAYEILVQMEQDGGANIKPNIFIYDQVLKACAFTKTRDVETRRQALKVALSVLTKLREDPDIEPLPNSYDLAIWACCGLTQGEELQRLLESIFQMCCHDGLLSDQVLRRLHTMAPPNVVEHLVGKETKVRAVPSSWSRNSKLAMPDKKGSRQHVVRERELRGERRFVDTRDRQ